jgi:hypothetical protein
VLFIWKIKCETRVKFEFENLKINRDSNKTKFQMKTKKKQKKGKMNSYLGRVLCFRPISSLTPAQPTYTTRFSFLCGCLVGPLCHTLTSPARFGCVTARSVQTDSALFNLFSVMATTDPARTPAKSSCSTKPESVELGLSLGYKP